MKKDELRMALVMMFAMYNKKQEKELLDIYYKFLKEYPKKIIVERIKHLIVRNKFFPALSEILEPIYEQEKLMEEEREYELDEKWQSFWEDFGKTVRGLPHDPIRKDMYPYVRKFGIKRLQNIESKEFHSFLKKELKSMWIADQKAIERQGMLEEKVYMNPDTSNLLS